MKLGIDHGGLPQLINNYHKYVKRFLKKNHETKRRASKFQVLHIIHLGITELTITNILTYSSIYLPQEYHITKPKA